MALDITCNNGNLIVRGLENFDLKAIFECGQCFRWESRGQDDYVGIIRNRALRISKDGESFIFHGCSREEFDSMWFPYFDINTDYSRIIAELSENDAVMKKASDFAPGIRILRQPLFETLISFIVSANNSIPNIKRVISRLCRAYGKEFLYLGETYHGFPEPYELAGAAEEDIRGMKAGYRSPYIIETAVMFSENPTTIAGLRKIGYDNAKNMLMKYPGVGAKVADCTLLFSGAYTNAFPVDVWVKKVMEEFYLERDTPLDQISGFAKVKFGELGGYAQQYLFYYARSNMNKKK